MQTWWGLDSGYELGHISLFSLANRAESETEAEKWLVVFVWGYITKMLIYRIRKEFLKSCHIVWSKKYNKIQFTYSFYSGIKAFINPAHGWTWTSFSNEKALALLFHAGLVGKITHTIETFYEALLNVQVTSRYFSFTKW